LAILEILSITNALREQILHDTSSKVIKDLALKEGLKTLRIAGLEKAKAGLTALDEVLRVSGSEV
jgi:type II secretory ATPase GspE/PulE/Tfp pilus assembly ATPase PilB-like protein